MFDTIRSFCIPLLILTCCFQADTYGQIPPPDALFASDAIEDQEFGYSVDIDGSVAVVGAFRSGDITVGLPDAGAAYIFRFDGLQWNEESILTADVPDAYDFFGWSVAISGNVAIVGNRNDDLRGVNAGSASVFRYDGATWSREATLTPSDAVLDDGFSWDVDIDGDVAVFGAPNRDNVVVDGGVAYIFRYNGTTWVEEMKLEASDENVQDLFGTSVAVDGNRVVVGSLTGDVNTVEAGTAYVYQYDGAVWMEEVKLVSPLPVSYGQFGISVDIDGDRIVVGANLENQLGFGSGSAWVFDYDGIDWSSGSALLAESDGNGFYQFGISVAVEGNTVLAGAMGWAPTGQNSMGRAYQFEYDALDNSWTETGAVSPTLDFAEFGKSVAISNGVILVGSPSHDQVQSNAGAAFAYGEPGGSTGIADETTLLPQMELSAPYPNPFSTRSELAVTTTDTENVRVSLVDVLGREVGTLFEGLSVANQKKQLSIDGINLPAGLYFVRLVTNSGVATKPVVLAR